MCFVFFTSSSFTRSIIKVSNLIYSRHGRPMWQNFIVHHPAQLCLHDRIPATTNSNSPKLKKKSQQKNNPLWEEDTNKENESK